MRIIYEKGFTGIYFIISQSVSPLFEVSSAVPAFDSCTKCVGSAGMINDRTPDYNPVSQAGMHGRPHN